MNTVEIVSIVDGIKVSKNYELYTRNGITKVLHRHSYRKIAEFNSYEVAEAAVIRWEQAVA
jgi:hypothetical protein